MQVYLGTFVLIIRIQTSLIFIHGSGHLKSGRINNFLAVYKCNNMLCLNCHIGTFVHCRIFEILGKSEFPIRTTNKFHVNALYYNLIRWQRF